MAPPREEDDWSDSDDENLAEIETSVLLGVPDGAVEAGSELNDAAVSRIGGLPAFLTAIEPPLSCSECKTCQTPMELLVQMWCPFEDSPMDRALYIWGCPRAGCQGKNGTVRAWRGLRYNEQYAVKLQKKLERQKAKAAQAKKLKSPQAAKVNPFSANASAAPSPFGLGAQIFGNSAQPSAKPDSTHNPSEADEGHTTDDGSDSEEEESLLTAMASIAITETPWKSAPSYPALYLSSVSEYLPAPTKLKLPDTAEVVDPAGKDTSWISEAYENSMDTDHVFDRFSKRVEAEPEQCVRYDLKGTPLPFQSDEVFNRLFPLPDSPPPAVTKAVFTVTSPQKRSFDPTSIPVCPVCRSKRVFECQLMPNLINVLRPKEGRNQKLTDDERRKAVEEALKKRKQDERRAMEWGTCMIFSCEKDCCLEDGTVKEDAKYSWREEEVLVQWDT